MITINQPYIEKKNGQSFLVSHIVDEEQHIEKDVFYSVPEEYGNYLVEEVADAFVVGCLLPAVLYGQDIFVRGAVSEKLFYNISNSVLYILSLIYKNKVNIKAEKLVNLNLESKAVGCGCSLGVDSFAAMLQHLKTPFGQESTPSSYRITHLTYFNVGAMGYVDLAKAKASYDKDIQMVLSFAKEVGLPVLSLESNFSIFYKDFDFDASGDLRNFSAALSLQKLFGKYLYGSSFPIADFKFDKGQTGYYESLLAPLLSTDNTEIIIANPDMSRIDKTKFIIDNPLTQKYLYVCWKELISNKCPDSEVAKVKDNRLNCTRCDKCKRTLLAIDLMGKLSLFDDIFDIPYWKKTKDLYVAKVICFKDDNAFYKDLYNLMHEYNYKPTSKAKRELIKLKLKTNIMKAGRKIKRAVFK